MKLVKWSNMQPVWPSFFDEEDWPFNSNFTNSNNGIDIYETDESVVVEAMVPGIPEDKINVTIEGNVLNITANYEEKEEDSDKKKMYKKSRQTSFSYSTSLPRMVDGSKADAEVENGIVKIVVPKTEQEKPKRIEIKSKSKK